ncbi:hypothetical protein CBM2587_B100088 [Cupriavidus taiwanensis]|uniref:Uncharacterized protein n=1 Tax=Cupriavidus taiwanensis TaxID=164546 RepID=A0A375C180_9BURK|nr:hypothetical protein CBM2587_B100088 [Cupriavidus taiwanensis]
MLMPAPAAPRARRHHRRQRRGRRNKGGEAGRGRRTWGDAGWESSRMITIRIIDLKVIAGWRRPAPD